MVELSPPVELSPLLAARWSPHAFDPGTEVTDAELASLLEAARWAPSAGNSQPWRFVLGRRDDETYQRILVNLTVADQRWAGRAAVLLVGAHLDTELSHAAYDLGQAVAHLTVQAATLGLHIHQLAGFDHHGLVAELELPQDVRPHVVIAVGRLGDPLSLPEDLRRLETGLRRRRPLTELLLN